MHEAMPRPRPWSFYFYFDSNFNFDLLETYDISKIVGFIDFACFCLATAADTSLATWAQALKR
jgi:hypothetical protein